MSERSGERGMPSVSCRIFPDLSASPLFDPVLWLFYSPLHTVVLQTLLQGSAPLVNTSSDSSGRVSRPFAPCSHPQLKFLICTTASRTNFSLSIRPVNGESTLLGITHFSIGYRYRSCSKWFFSPRLLFSRLLRLVQDFQETSLCTRSLYCR